MATVAVSGATNAKLRRASVDDRAGHSAWPASTSCKVGPVDLRTELDQLRERLMKGCLPSTRRALERSLTPTTKRVPVAM
jgi:hypothetical protein